MFIEVYRDTFGDEFTIGQMSINGAHFCYTLEDTDRHLESGGTKVFAQTAIPRGCYKVIMSFSPHFQKELPEVLDVKGFSGVRIHGGNTPADTEGCILVGNARDAKRGAIYQSTPAKLELIKRIKEAITNGEEVMIEIA